MAFEKTKFLFGEGSNSGTEDSGETAGVGVPRVYLYDTVDVETLVDDSGYFNDVVNEMGYTLYRGDLIFTHYDTDGTPGNIIYAVDNVVGDAPNAVVTVTAGAAVT